MYESIACLFVLKNILKVQISFPDKQMQMMQSLMKGLVWAVRHWDWTWEGSGNTALGEKTVLGEKLSCRNSGKDLQKHAIKH